jgi:phosphoribosylformylglycinamidine synthase
MGDACRALDFPIVSGNVSLYNESKATGGGSAILPTPAIGGVGLLEDWEKSASIAFKNEGDAIWLVGASYDFEPHIGRSLWLREIHGIDAGFAPAIDLEKCRITGNFIRDCIIAGATNAVHDVSDGGILVAIAEMALSGGLGANLHNIDHFGDWSDREKLGAETQRAIQRLFAENQGLYIVTAPLPADEFVSMADASGVAVFYMGNVRRDAIDFEYFDDDTEITLTDLRAAHESFFPKLMGSELTPEF